MHLNPCQIEHRVCKCHVGAHDAGPACVADLVITAGRAARLVFTGICGILLAAGLIRGDTRPRLIAGEGHLRAADTVRARTAFAAGLAVAGVLYAGTAADRISAIGALAGLAIAKLSRADLSLAALIAGDTAL